MNRSRFRLNYRFNLFQRQFLSQLLSAVVILVLLGTVVSLFSEDRIYATKEQELLDVGKSVIRALQKEEDPSALLTNYRLLLAERDISFVVMSANGMVLFRDARITDPVFRSKTFTETLRSRLPQVQDGESFMIEQQTEEPLMVIPRKFKVRGAKDEAYLFVLSIVQGVAETQQTIDRAIIYSVLSALLITTVTSWFISRNVSKSVNVLRRTTRMIAEGDLSSRSPENRKDELGDLSHDFNVMAAKLEEASDKLMDIEQRRGQFIMDVAHELRTPLTSIRGIVEGFKNDMITEPEEQHKYYAIIEKETFRLIRMINDLLDMERIRTGLVYLRMQTHSLKDLLELVVESLEVQINAKQLKIILDCPDEAMIFGDYDRLVQIFINLVKNSIQFTADGAIHIKAVDGQETTRIEISDTGEGMSLAEQEHMWERFFKADPSRSKEKGENGIGLSIVRQLVEAHRGTIDVESQPGVGTTFRLIFPLPAEVGDRHPAP